MDRLQRCRCERDVIDAPGAGPGGLSGSGLEFYARDPGSLSSGSARPRLVPRDFEFGCGDLRRIEFRERRRRTGRGGAMDGQALFAAATASASGRAVFEARALSLA